MWSVKYGPHPIEVNPNPGPSAFGQFSPQGPQQRLDRRPSDVGFHWILENGLERPALLAVHMEFMIPSNSIKATLVFPAS